MHDVGELWELLTRARHDLVNAAVGGIAPPRQGLSELEEWNETVADIPEGAVSAHRMAQAWGNLQLIMVECGPENAESDHTAAWRRIRRAADEGFQALLNRAEWSSLHPDFREDVLPRLTDAVGQVRAGRIERCMAAVRHLRLLAQRTGGAPHAWRLHLVAEMLYPQIDAAGWRGRMGLEFSWRRAQAVTVAILDEIQRQDWVDRPLLVGYDSRAHADQLARYVTEIATAGGQSVHLCRRDTPTPVLLDYLAETVGSENAAGLLVCTASHLPVKDLGAGRYTGQPYQGIVFFQPSGMPAPEEMRARMSRHAAELLLEDADVSVCEPTGNVTIFNPFAAYCRRVTDETGYLVTTADGEEETAREALREYWGATEALVVIDEMHGAARGYLPAVCRELGIRHEVLHGEADPLFGHLLAANPEPPYLSDLTNRVRELSEEHRPVIGLAFDADADRLGVVDESGAYLPGGMALALLADFLLGEGYPGEPGVVMRSRDATRALDRLTALPEYAGHTLSPTYRNHLPPYMQAEGYQQLTGDPRALHGSGVYIAADLAEITQPLLIGGNARNGIYLREHAGKDAIRAALLLLQLCAVRRLPVRELWQQLQERIGVTHIERLELPAPDTARLALINRYMKHYAGAQPNQLATSDYQLDGCTVLFAGGTCDRFIEWALLDADGDPAYLTISQLHPEEAVRIDVEARTAERAHRLLLAVGERLEAIIGELLHRAETPWKIVELLAGIASPLATAAELPGTLNCHLAEEAYSRLQELARPGREAPELLRFVTERLHEWRPENARALAACHVVTKTTKKKSPPPPRVHWESEGEQS